MADIVMKSSKKNSINSSLLSAKKMLPAAITLLMFISGSDVIWSSLLPSQFDSFSRISWKVEGSSTSMNLFYNLIITINVYLEKDCGFSPLTQVNKLSSNKVFVIFTISLNDIDNVFFSSTPLPNLRLIMYIIWFEVYIWKSFITRKFLEYLKSR